MGPGIDYPNDLLDINLSSIRIGDGFDPSLGFVPRNNVHIWDFGFEINPRPNWSWMRQMFYELSFTLFNGATTPTGKATRRPLKPFDWLLESGDRFELGIEPEGDARRDNSRSPPTSTSLPAPTSGRAYFIGATSAEKRRGRAARCVATSATITTAT